MGMLIKAPLKLRGYILLIISEDIAHAWEGRAVAYQSKELNQLFALKAINIIDKDEYLPSQPTDLLT
jgi:hypothetical protein